MKLEKLAVNALVIALVVLSGEINQVRADPINPNFSRSWSSGEGCDAMTDKQWYRARTVNLDELSVYCHPPAHTLDVILTTKDYLGDGFRTLQYRVDQRSPIQVFTSYGKKKLDLPDRFVADAKGGKNVLIRFSSYDHTMIDREFSLDGFDQVVETLRTHCPALKTSKTAPVAAIKPHIPEARPANATDPCWRPLPPRSAPFQEKVAEQVRYRRCLWMESR